MRRKINNIILEDWQKEILLNVLGEILQKNGKPLTKNQSFRLRQKLTTVPIMQKEKCKNMVQRLIAA